MAAIYLKLYLLVILLLLLSINTLFLFSLIVAVVGSISEDHHKCMQSNS
jgi:hypothetical protein